MTKFCCNPAYMFRRIYLFCLDKKPGLHPSTVRSGEHQEWQGLHTDTVLRYRCILTVAVCHSRCLRAASNAPSRAQLFIEELTSRVWDGRTAGEGIVRLRGPRGARDSRFSCLWTHSWMPAHDIRGHKAVRCYSTV